MVDDDVVEADAGVDGDLSVNSPRLSCVGSELRTVPLVFLASTVAAVPLLMPISMPPEAFLAATPCLGR
jgi:hypothetical protein